MKNKGVLVNDEFRPLKLRSMNFNMVTLSSHDIGRLYDVGKAVGS